MRMTEEDVLRAARDTAEYDVVVESRRRLAAPESLVRRYDDGADPSLDPGSERGRLVPVPHGNSPELEAAGEDVTRAEQALERFDRVGVVVSDDDARSADVHGSKQSPESFRGNVTIAIRRSNADGFGQVAQTEDRVVRDGLDQRQKILGRVIRPLEGSWHQVRIGETKRRQKRFVQIRR